MNIVKTSVPERTTEKIIKNTAYIVNSFFSETARETAEQKLLRLVTERVSVELLNEKSTSPQLSL
jgi:hypothetical protein